MNGESSMATPDFSTLAEASKDATMVKTQLIDKLINENKKVLETLHALEATSKETIRTLKRDAALVMERLVADNAWYRDQNSQLETRLEQHVRKEKQSKENAYQLAKQHQQVLHEKHVLSRCVDTLRQKHTTLEFQTQHVGAAFLTLREAVVQFLSNPLLLETESTNVPWERRRESDEFKAAVISTIQGTNALTKTLEALDYKLVQLNLIDPLTALPINKPDRGGSLTLMGEKLVPYKDVVDVKKERQMWQKRYFKQESELARLKIETEALVDTIKTKEKLVTKLQSDKRFCSVKSTTIRHNDALRAGLEKENEELKKKVESLRVSHEDQLKRWERERVQEPRRSSNSNVGIKTLRSSADAAAFMTSNPQPQPTCHVSPRIHIMKADTIKHNTALPRLSQKGNPAFDRVFAPVLSKALSTSKPFHSETPLPQRMASRTVRAPVSSSMSPDNADSNTHSTQREAQSTLQDSSAPFSSSITSRTSSLRKIGTTIQQSEYQTPLARELSALTQTQNPHSPNSGAPTHDMLRQGSKFLGGITKSPTRDSTTPVVQRPALHLTHSSRLAHSNTSVKSVASRLRSLSKPRVPQRVVNDTARESLLSLSDGQTASSHASSLSPLPKSPSIHSSLSSQKTLGSPKQKTLSLTASQQSLSNPQALDFLQSSSSKYSPSSANPESAPSLQSRYLMLPSRSSTPTELHHFSNSTSINTEENSTLQLAKQYDLLSRKDLGEEPDRLDTESTPKNESFKDHTTQEHGMKLDFVNMENHGHMFPSTSASQSLDLRTASSSETMESMPYDRLSYTLVREACDISYASRNHCVVSQQIANILCNTPETSRIVSSDLRLVLLSLQSSTSY